MNARQAVGGRSVSARYAVVKVPGEALLASNGIPSATLSRGGWPVGGRWYVPPLTGARPAEAALANRSASPESLRWTGGEASVGVAIPISLNDDSWLHRLNQLRSTKTNLTPNVSTVCALVTVEISGDDHYSKKQLKHTTDNEIDTIKFEISICQNFIFVLSICITTLRYLY